MDSLHPNSHSKPTLAEVSEAISGLSRVVPEFVTRLIDAGIEGEITVRIFDPEKPELTDEDILRQVWEKVSPQY